jgi:sugar phosphate isomerase/epimerase
VKIGLSSWAFRWAAGTRTFAPPQPLNHHDLLARAHALGAQVVQICDNMPLDHLDDAGLLALRRDSEARALTLEVGTASTRRQHLARFIGIARLLDARILRVVEDMKDWQPTVEDIAAELRSVLPACRQHDVTIAVENHTAIGVRDLARLVQLVGDPRLGVCLDTANSVARLEGWREATTTLAPHAVSLHLKDAVAEKKGVGFYVSGSMLGQGVVDLPWVLREVHAHGRSPNALYEAWMEFAHDGPATLRQEEQWIADGLAYLRAIAAPYIS